LIHEKGIYACHCRTGGSGSPSTAGRPMEAHHPFSSLRWKSATLFGLRAADPGHLPEDAGPTIAAAGSRRGCFPEAVSAGSPQGRIPTNGLGTSLVPCVGCNAKVGGTA